MNDLKDFLESLRAPLENIRTKEQAQVRLLSDDKEKKITIEMVFFGTARGRGTMCWDVGYEDIVNPKVFGVTGIVRSTVRTITNDLRNLDLVYEPPFRAVSREMSGTTGQSGDIVWKTTKTETIWEGFSVEDYGRDMQGKIGRVEANDQGPVLTKVIWTLQELSANRWADLDPQPKFSTPPKPRADSDRSVLPSLAMALKPKAAPPFNAGSPGVGLDPGPTATERKRDRQQQATANRQAARIDPKEEERRVELRRRAEVEAEASKRRAEEERIKRERISSIEKSATVSWDKSKQLVHDCTQAWREAAVHEADARDAQVEAELFGGGSDVDAGEKWIEAESAARDLLAFAQARIEEAQARRTGKGFENIYDVSDEIDEGEALVEREGIQEHTGEDEFDEVRNTRELEAVKREEEDRLREEESALAEPPETGDEGMDELLEGRLGPPDEDDEPSVVLAPKSSRGSLWSSTPGISIPGIITKPF